MGRRCHHGALGIDLLKILYLSNASVHHQPDPLSSHKPIVWSGNSCLMVQWSDCWCFLLYSSLFAPHTTSEDQTYNTAKSRDWCTGNFHILGKFGEILHFPIRKLSYFPIKKFPKGEITHVPSRETPI